MGVRYDFTPARGHDEDVYVCGLLIGAAIVVAGAPMYASKTLVENAVDSKDHTTLVAAVKAARLVETLSGPGPFTVFAPTNAAFAKLPAGTVDTLVRSENQAMLTSIPTCHAVPGRITAANNRKKAKANKGTATYGTVNGGSLSFTRMGKGHHGRQRRPRDDHHRERHSVERRDARRRHGADAVSLHVGAADGNARPLLRVISPDR